MRRKPIIPVVLALAFSMIFAVNDEPATVCLTFLTKSGPVAGPSAVLPANSRQARKANEYVTAWYVSNQIQSDRPVAAERAMYGNNRTWAHDSIGYAP